MIFDIGTAYAGLDALNVTARAIPGEGVDLVFKGQDGKEYHVTLELQGAVHVAEACMRAVAGTDMDLLDLVVL